MWPGYARSVGKDGFFHFMAFDADRPVAIAALCVFEGLGYLFAAATAENDRRRGAQQALIAAESNGPSRSVARLWCRRPSICSSTPTGTCSARASRTPTKRKCTSGMPDLADCCGPKMLTPDMKRIIEEQRLGFVATVNADGTPNVSPKGTFVVVDDATIAFGDIRSPGTLRNLRIQPARRGELRRSIRAQGLSLRRHGRRGGARRTAALTRSWPISGVRSRPRMRAIVTITVTKALPLTSPAYDDGTTEVEIRRVVDEPVPQAAAERAVRGSIG